MSTTLKGLTTVLVAAILTMALTATAFAGTISGKDAVKTALHDAGFSKSQVSGIEVEQDKNSIEVEFVCKKTKAEYDYDIAKNGGGILEKNVEYRYKHNASKAKVGKKAVLKKVTKFSGIKYSVVKKAKCTYKYKKNEGTYSVKFRYNGYKYEYELLAPTGKVIEWEMDRIRR